MANRNGEGGGAKAFGGLMAVLALIGAITALWKPMNDRIEHIEKTIEKEVARIDRHHEKHLEKGAHPQAGELMARASQANQALVQRVESVEHRLAKHIESDWHAGAGAHLAEIRANIDEIKRISDSQDRLIKLLWSRSYGGDIPSP